MSQNHALFAKAAKSWWSDFKEPSKVLTTPRAQSDSASAMEALHCSKCGTLVAHVSDRRFGLVPTHVTCVYCSTPAFRRPVRVATH